MALPIARRVPALTATSKVLSPKPRPKKNILGTGCAVQKLRGKKVYGYFSHIKKGQLLFLQRQKTLDGEKYTAVVNFQNSRMTKLN